MRKMVCLMLCFAALWMLSPAARAQEPENGFSEICGEILPVEQVCAEDSVISTSITFENVPSPRECILRWYINDTLCYEDRSFPLTEGAVSEFRCSVHFDNDTPAASTVWAELTANDGSGRAVFYEQFFARPIRAAEHPDGDDYIIHVLRNQCVVIVYEKNEAGEPGRVVNVFACSPGQYDWTITGRYTATDREEWLSLVNYAAGQYATLIWGNFLFHSVPYYGFGNDCLKTGEYNLLGQKASAGCIRLAVSDAKWIYDNCLSGTSVRLFDSDTLPVTKPVPISIDPDSPDAGWDPTDPHPDNPTRARYFPVLSGMPGPGLTPRLLFHRLAV